MSNSQEVYATPERLRSFSRQLNAYAKFVEKSAGDLSGLMNRLHEGWSDKKFEEFDEQFKRAQKLLKKFSNEVDRTAPKIERDAEMLEEVLAQKLHT
jgi:uncharacterized protein YukE